MVLAGADKQALLAEFAVQLAALHPPLPSQPRVTGWCSRYHYYAEVTGADISENLQQMQSRIPGPYLVQIDDGYQAAMGDWLSSSPRFAHGLKPLLSEISAVAGRLPSGSPPSLPNKSRPFSVSTPTGLFRMSREHRCLPSGSPTAVGAVLGSC